MANSSSRDQLRQRLIGLGERSIKKSYYPELQKRLNELERFRDVLDRASDAIFLAEADTGHIADLNRAATELTGYSREELHSRSLFGLFDHGLDLRSIGSQSVITKLRTASGTSAPIELSLWFRSFSKSDYVVCIVRDVSARLKANAEREALIEELERKNIELERFLYTASHDLKTPLTTVKGFTGLLKEDIASGDLDAVATDLNHIDLAVDHMIALLDDVLELSRVGNVTLQEDLVDLDELAREAVHLVDYRLQKQGIRVKVMPELPVVRGDRIRLMEVFQNLLDNAAKFTTAEESVVTISSDKDENDIHTICITDQGVGIDERYHDNVFGLFNQLDPKQPGTGVGLTIVKRVVELHGGRIWVNSEGPGHGCSFCFTLGASPPRTPPSR